MARMGSMPFGFSRVHRGHAPPRAAEPGGVFFLLSWALRRNPRRWRQPRSAPSFPSFSSTAPCGSPLPTASSTLACCRPCSNCSPSGSSPASSRATAAPVGSPASMPRLCWALPSPPPSSGSSPTPSAMPSWFPCRFTAAWAPSSACWSLSASSTAKPSSC